MTRDAAMVAVTIIAAFLAGVGFGAILNGIAYTHHIRRLRLHARGGDGPGSTRATVSNPAVSTRPVRADGLMPATDAALREAHMHAAAAERRGPTT